VAGLASAWEPTPTPPERPAMPPTSRATTGAPLLPVPEIPVRRSNGPNEGPVTFTAGHYFSPVGDLDPRALAEAADAPLSVIVQVTKRCDFGCVFCSETLMMPDPTLDQLDVIRANTAALEYRRAIVVSAWCTSPAVSSRSRWAPMVARIGARTFSFFLMVLADRPDRRPCRTPHTRPRRGSGPPPHAARSMCCPVPPASPAWRARTKPARPYRGLGSDVRGEEQPDQGAVGPGYHHPGDLGVAHPVRQRGGIFAGPHRGHAESHHRPCLRVCGGG